MNVRTYEPMDDTLAEPPDAAVVHWMQPGRLSVGPAGLSATAAGAFALGVLAALATLALIQALEPRPSYRRMARLN